MKFEYTFEGMKLKVLDETFAGKVLEFYSRNREEFDRYEAAKPDNFYTTEYIAATLKAEYAALLKGEFGRFFLFSDDMPGEILGSVSFFGVTSINRSCRIGYKIDKNYRQLGLGSLMVKHMLEILTRKRRCTGLKLTFTLKTSPLLILSNLLALYLKVPPTPM